MGLWYSKDYYIALTAFTDADHAGCQDTRRSTFGNFFTKALGREQLDFLINKLGMRSVSPEMLKRLEEICPRLPNQEFVVDPSFDLEIISFIKELGYIGDIDSVNKVYTDHMHQPWRIYVAVINRCLCGKTTDNRDSKKQEKIYNPRFTKTERSKGIELLSEAAILEEAQLQKAIKRIKRETKIHQAGGLSKGASLEPKVLDEQKSKSTNTSEGTRLKPGVPNVSKDNSSKSEYESWGDSDDDDDDQQGNDERTESNNDKDVYINKTDKEEEDRFVHTPNDYVPTDDENIDDEEYDRINKEMYSDVNVELKDIELEGKGKDDKEMTDVGHVDAEHENVNQEVVGDQVKDVDQATVTAAPATKKIEVPLPISSMSSDYATKFLNFDNIPSAKIGIISMMDIKVQHEDQTPATTIPPYIPPFIPLPQQSTPIPTPTTIETTISTTSVIDSSTLTAIHQRLSDLENEVKTLRNVDHSSTIHTTIMSEVPTVVKEYLGTNLDGTLHKVIQRHTAELIKEHSVLADVIEIIQYKQKPQKSVADIRKIKMEQKRTLFETMNKTKSFNKNTKRKALYHALMESILEDEDAMDKGVAERLKKRKPDDADKDEGPPAKPNQGLKGRRRISDLTQDILIGLAYKILKGTCKSYVELEYNLEEYYKALNDQLDWNNPKGDRYPFDLSKPLPLMKAAKYDLQGIEDMVPNLWSPIKVAYNRHALLGTPHWRSKRQTFYGYASNRVSKHDVYSAKRTLALINVKVNVWYGYDHLEEIEVRRSNQQLYKFIKGDFLRLHLNEIEDMLILIVQNRLFNLKGLDIMHLLERNRLVYSHEIYKFGDGTLISVQDKLKDMLNNLEMGYTSVMPRRIWSNLDKKRSRIMIKDINRQLLERRLMRSLEKFVGGREYEKDLRLL
ncbi:hypothetical protein Tco_1310966 [Tanacetum coccineum]